MEVPIGFGGRKLDVGTWTYGLLAEFIQGGANAISAGVGAIAFDPNDFNFQTGRFYGLMGTVFLASGLMNAMKYLGGHPLPTVRVVETVERSPHTTTVIRVTEGPKDIVEPPNGD